MSSRCSRKSGRPTVRRTSRATLAVALRVRPVRRSPALDRARLAGRDAGAVRLLRRPHPGPGRASGDRPRLPPVADLHPGSPVPGPRARRAGPDPPHTPGGGGRVQRQRRPNPRADRRSRAAPYRIDDPNGNVINADELLAAAGALTRGDSVPLLRFGAGSGVGLRGGAFLTDDGDVTTGTLTLTSCALAQDVSVSGTSVWSPGSPALLGSSGEASFTADLTR
jgi:hypothetical protein